MSESNRELTDFLRRARGQVDPARAGLPADGRVRRVPGLRREEVALLAGVSTDYYIRLEQGRRITPSEGVLDGIAKALDLGPAGRAHLGHLVGPTPSSRRRPSVVQRVRPGLHQLLESLRGQPAMILGRRTDVLATNSMARALFADFDALRPAERNYARWMFLSAQARALFLDWETQGRAVVGTLRLDTGGAAGGGGAASLVADLAERSPEFRRWWSEHRVYERTHGSKALRHPIVGDLTVDYETFVMPGDADQTLFLYTAEAATRSREALDLLASWVLTDSRGPRARPQGLPARD